MGLYGAGVDYFLWFNTFSFNCFSNYYPNLFLFLSALSIENVSDFISCPLTSDILSQKTAVYI